MPFVKRHRKYYRFLDEGGFIRPNLAANGTLGGDSFAVAASTEGMNGSDLAYKAFDGNTSGTGLDFWHSKAQKSPWWITWYNPKLVCLKSLTIYNCQYPGIKDYEIQGSNDNDSWEIIKTITGATTTQKTNYTIDLSDNTKKFKYHRLYITATAYAADGYYWATIAEIGMTGTVYSVEESTPDDYDYYEDKENQYILTRRERKYYKPESWTQPYATAETTAIDGGNMTVTASSTNGSYYPYRIVSSAAQGSSNVAMWESKSSSAWWQIKLPYKIKLNSIKLYNKSSNSGWQIKQARIYTSSDLSTPITDEFTMTNGSGALTEVDCGGYVTDTICFQAISTYAGNAGLNKLELYGERLVLSNEGNYDYYEEKLTPYHLTVNNRIY